MLHEYAVEPELVATWCTRASGRYFLEKFGLGFPRILSIYPRHKHWKGLVEEAWSKGNDATDRKRMVELIQRLSDVNVVRRNAFWSPDRTWLDNAITEHQRIPFHAILARHNPRRHPTVLVAGLLDERTSLWSVPHGVVVRRAATKMACAVRDMLRMAGDIVFVDPYFSCSPDRCYVEVLSACLQACIEHRIPGGYPRVRILTVDDSDDDRKRSHGSFENQCRERLPSRLAVGQQVEISRLKGRTNGEQLHNRYILTELGGVSFGAGLDEKPGAAFDDLFLLTRRQYEKRWLQYAAEPPDFDQPEDTIVIVGSGEPTHSPKP
jgi:hypothetical protein